MRTSIAAAAAALVAGASAAHNVTGPIYTTEVLTAFTTYCPSPTSIVHNNQTYTITSATTFTITDCPCTVTKPVTTKVITTCSACANPTTVVTTPIAAATPGLVHSPAAPVVHSQPSAAPPVYHNTTSPAAPVKPTSVPGAAKPTEAPSATGPANPGFTGAANRAVVASGAGLAGVVALAAYFL